MNIGEYPFYQPNNVPKFLKLLKHEYEVYILGLQINTKHQCEIMFDETHSIQRQFLEEEYERLVNNAYVKCNNIAKRVIAVDQKLKEHLSIMETPTSSIGTLSPQSSINDDLFCYESLDPMVFEDRDKQEENIASRKLCFDS